jgi:cellulose synthase/poly-beta-1,6-N-acetylglucosamine synthase-like glycosyltransferase
MVSIPSETDWVAAGIPGLLSVVIPARNEAKNLQVVVPTVLTALEGAGINHEILVVNDGSTDDWRDATLMCASSIILRQMGLGWPYEQASRISAGRPLPS